MKTSEIYKEGEQIIKDIYYPVLKSNDKELWKRAIDSMMKRVLILENDRNVLIKHNNPYAREIIKQLWFWESALDNLIARYGKKFVIRKDHK